VEQPAAVDVDGLPRDERGGGAHEERHQGRDVLGPATARDALALDLVLRPRTVPVLSLLDTRPFARYGYVEYADARAYGQQAAEAVTALRALTASGRAADAVEVAREALRALERTYGETDDSDGLIGEVANGLAEAHPEGLPDRPARSGGDRRVALEPPAGRRRRRHGHGPVRPPVGAG
jgi:Arc/MetJ-type ribon-helix-helix transcriptional regulator